MTERLVVIGAGGFGRETVDVVEAINAAAPEPRFELLGVIDGMPSETNLSRLADRGIPYLGTEESWLAMGKDAFFAVGIGATATRERVTGKLLAAGKRPTTLVHPNAVIGSRSTVGAGSILCSGVQVTTNVQIGEHVHLNVNVTVGHDSILEEFVSINPCATISGEVVVERGSYIGTTAVVLQNLRVGAGSVVGASACVVRDVPAGVTVKGVPAR